jgi:hypothetical protein
MRKPKMNILVLHAIIMTTAIGSLASAYPYKATFIGNPKEYEVEPGVPGIKTKVNFGPILSTYDYPYWCWPPPPFFYVAVDWRSPNNPDCWINIFSALESMGVGPWYTIYRGNGSILPTHGPPLDMTCYWPLRCGYNQFEIKVWPLVSGEYRFRLISFNFYLWPMGCNPNKPFFAYDFIRPYISDERSFKIHEEANDFIVFSHLYYFGEQRSDTTFDGGSLHVFSDYRIITKIISTKLEETIPEQLTGYLTPEGALTPLQILFNRWRDGDEGPPCDPTFPVRIYAYESEESINPFMLWDYEPHEWSELIKELKCQLYGVENGVEDDIESTVYVMSMINLDCQNDSTVCFIPVNCEQMDFIFRYNSALDISEDAVATFNINNGQDNLVYSIGLPLNDFQYEPNDFGIPNAPLFRSFPIFWDGRDNQDIINPDHCVDPEFGSYNAHVFIDDPHGDIMSNVETFDVAPAIDSILITHIPSYPPPQPLENVEIISVIKGRIDDSGNPASDFRYYRPYGETEGELDFWDNETYWFWDLLAPAEPERRRFYFEDNEALTLPLRDWLPEDWGELSYKWKVIHDWRTGQYTVGYSDIRDTTSYWGNEWKACISSPYNWPLPTINPYMRFLIVSEIFNTKNAYRVQDYISEGGRNAHKLIFTQDTGAPGLDIVDWAVSHIGVPYAIKDGHHKLPYEKIECSSFVTAARIQEIGAINNTKYAVSYITANDYLRGYYKFLGEDIKLTTKVNPCTDPDIGIGRGYLLHLRQNQYMPHITIMMQLYYNCQDRAAYWCFIIHARGGYPPRFGRVCFDNAEREYPNWTPENPNGYHYNYLKWVE